MDKEEIDLQLKQNLTDLYVKQDFNTLLEESKKYIQKYILKNTFL